MPVFRPRKFTFFPFLILFKRIESIDMTPCVISFLVYSIFIGSFIASARKSDIKNDELKMSIRALRTLTLKQSYKWPLFKLIFFLTTR